MAGLIDGYERIATQQFNNITIEPSIKFINLLSSMKSTLSLKHSIF